MATATTTQADVLTLRINGTTYGFEPIPPGEFGTVAYRLARRGTDRVYDVIRTHAGIVACDCPDYEARHRDRGLGMCKHGRTLVELGLVPAPKAPNILEPTRAERQAVKAPLAPLTPADEPAGPSTPIDRRVLPAIDGAGLTTEEGVRLDAARTRATAAYRRDCPDAPAAELARVSDAAARDALRRVLRDRPAAQALPGSTDEDEAPGRFSSLAELAEFEALIDADVAFRRSLVERLPLPFVSMTHDVPLNTSMRRDTTLEQFIEAEARDFDPEAGEDRAIWRDGRLLAVIRCGASGEPEVLRLDSMADADEMLEDGGLEGDPAAWPAWTDADRWVPSGEDQDDNPAPERPPLERGGFFEATVSDRTWWAENCPSASKGPAVRRIPAPHTDRDMRRIGAVG